MLVTLPRWDRHGYGFAVACVVGATVLFVLAREYFAKEQWALLYLLIIIFVAGTGGFRASAVAALLAFLAWDFFFLPPYNTLLVADPKDWLSLVVFLAVGLAMGLSTSRMHEREADARARERESALLSRLSANLVSIASTRLMTETLLNEISTTIGAHTAMLYLADAEGGLTPVPSPTPPAEETRRTAEWVFRQNKAIGLPRGSALTKLDIEGWPITVSPDDVAGGADRRDIYLPLQSPSRIEGVLYVGERADGAAYSPHDARLLVSITNLATSFLERRRLEETASRAEAVRESERLKSTLISSVSHELKTPLAAVTATVTSLLEEDVAWEPAAVRGELSAVREDLGRLTDSIGELLDLSRLKADAWMPQRDWFEFGEIVGAAMNKLPAASRRRIDFQIPDGLPPLFVDFQQWLQAILHLLENALAYSPPAARVVIGAAATARELRMWVEDAGAGVPSVEREHIFEQFYRGSAATSKPTGTGLGLAITAEIVRFHGGRIWVENVQPHGARFLLALPRGGEPTGGDA